MTFLGPRKICLTPNTSRLRNEKKKAHLIETVDTVLSRLNDGPK